MDLLLAEIGSAARRWRDFFGVLSFIKNADSEKNNKGSRVLTVLGQVAVILVLTFIPIHEKIPFSALLAAAARAQPAVTT